VLTTSVERLEGTTAKLTITVTADAVEASIAEAYKQIGAKLRIPGFRKGRAPRAVVDNYVGREYVLTEATEGIINDYYPQAVDAEGLRPIDSPEVDQVEPVVAGQDFTFSLEVELRPELEVGAYDDIKVTVPRKEANDADIDAQLAELRERFASLEPIEDRGIEANDYVLLSFVGYVDGDTYEGNTVDKYLYEMGRGLMPVEFDEGILGLTSGADTRVKFTIPDTSSNEEYIGKQAQFDIQIHEIKAKQLPEVDDAFAAEMGFDSADLLREDLRGRLTVQRTIAFDRAKEKAAREALAERTPGTIPEAMIKSRASSLESDFNSRLQDQGLTLEQYANMTGMTRETFDEQIAGDAEQQVREDLALEALFRKLGLEVTDDDIDSELEDLAKASKTTVEEAREKWQKMGLMSVIAEGVMHRKAVEWLMENVATVEVDDEAAGNAEPISEKKKTTTKKRASKKAAKADDVEETPADESAE